MDTKKQILKQMEFYFSDANLVRDKFMKIEMAKTEQGQIPIRVFLTFKKIQALTADLKDDNDQAAKVALIIEALADSTQLQVENEAVLRKEKFDLNMAEDSRDDRIVVVSEIPAETRLDEMIQLFNETLKEHLHEKKPDYLGSAIVRFQSRMNSAGGKHKTASKEFNGKAWVELHTAEDAQLVLELAQSEQLRLGDSLLKAVSKSEFLKELKNASKPSSCVSVTVQVPDADAFDLEQICFAIKREFVKFGAVAALEVKEEECTDFAKKFLLKLNAPISRNGQGKIANMRLSLGRAGEEGKPKYDCQCQCVPDCEVKSTFLDAGKLVRFIVTLPEAAESGRKVEPVDTLKLKMHFASKYPSLKFVEFTPSTEVLQQESDVLGSGFARFTDRIAMEVQKDSEAGSFEPFKMAVVPDVAEKSEGENITQNVVDPDAPKSSENIASKADEAAVTSDTAIDNSQATDELVTEIAGEKFVSASIKCEAVTGAEEQEYWQNRVYRQQTHHQHNGKRSRDGRDGGKRNKFQRTGR